MTIRYQDPPEPEATDEYEWLAFLYPQYFVTDPDEARTQRILEAASARQERRHEG